MQGGSVRRLCACITTEHCTLHTCILVHNLNLNWAHTNSDSRHSSTAVPIAVGGHNTDSVYHIVGHSDCNTCSTGGECTDTRSDHDGVAN